MEFDISKILNQAYRKIAEDIDATSSDAKTKGNKKLDGGEISIFLNKVNEQEGASYRESDVGILLGFESGPLTSKSSKDVVLHLNSKEYNGNLRILLQPSDNSTVIPEHVAEEAKPISINIDEDCNIGVAQAMIKALEAEKAGLMATLSISNETYDQLAELVLAVAMEESKFGTDPSKEFHITKNFKHMLNRALAMWDLKDEASVGYTLLKMGNIMEIAQNKRENEEFEKNAAELKGNSDAINLIQSQYAQCYADMCKHGVKGKDDVIASPRNCAVATLIYMSHRVDILETICNEDTKEYRTQSGYHDLNSRLKASPEEVSYQDMVAWIWNSGYVSILDGMCTPENKSNGYTQRIRKYLEKINVTTVE